MATPGGPYKQWEARILLGGVDYSTFIDWCKKVTPAVVPMKREKHPRLKIDTRALWYSRASLERIAVWRGITLLSDEELMRTSSSAEGEQLTEQLEDLEQRLQIAIKREVERQVAVALGAIRQEIDERIRRFEQQIQTRIAEDLKGSLLPNEIESLIIALVAEQFDKSYSSMKTELADLVREQVQRQTHALTAHRSEASPKALEPRSSAHVPSPSEPVPLAPGQQLIISTLPTNKGKEERPTSFYQITRTSDGHLAAFGEFVELHGVSLSTAKHAKDRTENPLPTVKVAWPKGKGYINLALDVGGQAKLHELYSSKQEFRPCELCPHTPDKYPAT